MKKAKQKENTTNIHYKRKNEKTILLCQIKKIFILFIGIGVIGIGVLSYHISYNIIKENTIFFEKYAMPIKTLLLLAVVIVFFLLVSL
ncbi:hypothetical protein D7V86_24955 [bacterium D16-51]|nr:hypothetical protein D7V96_24020 [bacterium D16-59]RKI53527.1 hypothetical protein D7V86_24955 [bacterium D16-51]